MDPEVPQDEEAPVAPVAPQPAEIDPRMALEIAAREYGMSPDELESSMRLQDENRRVYEENRKRSRDLELKEAQLEALARERRQYAPPEPTYDVDPAVRPIYDKVNRLESILMQERQERADEARAAQRAQRLGQELNSHYQTVMRTVPSQSQIQPEQFFGAMAELWPDGPPESVSPAQAVERTARYLGVRTNGNGYTARPSPYVYGDPNRNPRAPIVIPTGQAPTTQPLNPMHQSMQDILADRPGETPDQKAMRLQAALESLAPGFKGLPDGMKVSSG
jgi:hypothetical protein